MNYELRKKEGTRRARPVCVYRTGRSARLFRHSNAPCSRGFTLIEMIVSVGLFSVAMVATVGVLLSVVDANHKAQGLKVAIDNLSLALDSMTRNIRTGTTYASFGGNGACQNLNGSNQGVIGISFLDHGGVSTIYERIGNSIQISKNNGSFSQLTGSEITIDRLCFYINGAAGNAQPNVLVTIGGYATAAGQKTKTKSRFDIQSLIVERLPGVL